jgi:hypothetical protein
MKIQKEFAPITITLETPQDLNDLLTMLHTAEWHYVHGNNDRWNQDQVEKLRLFIKDLK